MAEQRMIGDILAGQRRNLGLTVERVASDTKLQRRTVEIIEDSDFDAMPPGGYARAYVSSYARYLDLDPEAVLGLYDEQLLRHRRAQRAAASSGRDRRGSSRTRTTERDRRQDRTSDGYDMGYTSPEERPRATRGSRGGSSSSGTGRSARPTYEPRDTRTANGYGSGRDGRTAPAPRGTSTSYGDGSRRPSSTTRTTAPSGGYAAPREPREPRDGARTTARGGTQTARGTRGGRSGGQERPVERVTNVDDGYEGGSGRPDTGGGRRPGRPGTPPASDRQSLAEVFRGLLDALLADRRAFLVVVGSVGVLLVLVVVLGASSCMRGSSSDGGDAGTIPVTSVGAASSSADGQDGDQAQDQTQDQTQSSVPLDPYVDLSALPANSVVTVSVSDASAGPWIDATVDGSVVYAQITPAGSSLEWTVTSAATLNFSSVDGVSVTVNGVSVAPASENGTLTLSMSVAADQQPAAADDSGGASSDDEGSSDDGNVYYEDGYYDSDGDWHFY